MPQNMMTIIMLVVLAALVFFMFRSSRKRQRAQQELQSQIMPGAEVMTNFGLYGTIVSMDPEENKVRLEVGSGTVLTLHRQAIARVVTETAEEPTLEEPSAAEAAPGAEDGAEPRFGERLDSGDDQPGSQNDD